MAAYAQLLRGSRAFSLILLGEVRCLLLTQMCRHVLQDGIES